ncbi:hypothetical protein [Bradyrhizobium commune]|uniref:Uncharacterized protein n=1 Tax=Bradyrhizobium commune TaxID=83627 RepID=A0A7S9H0I9_9BRAD|nr:hypothetical protein [Bradyrhizobium commune]QPF92638.1 hypothetical protein IC761_04945 [Bradyrhizobium commune]
MKRTTGSDAFILAAGDDRIGRPQKSTAENPVAFTENVAEISERGQAADIRASIPLVSAMVAKMRFVRLKYRARLLYQG